MILRPGTSRLPHHGRFFDMACKEEMTGVRDVNRPRSVWTSSGTGSFAITRAPKNAPHDSWNSIREEVPCPVKDEIIFD